MYYGSRLFVFAALTLLFAPMSFVHADAYGNAKSVDDIPFVTASLNALAIVGVPGNDGIPSDTVALGVTHVETNLAWSLLEPQKDRWDTTELDKAIASIQQRHLKMLAASNLAPPDWFKQTPDYTPLVNIRTGETSSALPPEMPQMSPWAQGTFAGHERFYAFLAAHYRDKIDALRFCVEVGLPIKGGDFWCGDKYARADFRSRMLAKYRGLKKLNAAWGTEFASNDDIVYPDLAQRATQPLRWIDFVTWYQDSQVRAEQTELTLIRKYFPKTPIDVPLGGSSDVASDGCDRTALIHAAAAFPPIAVRSMHGSLASDKSPQSYWFYKRMAPLCHDLSLGFGTETSGTDLTYDEIRRRYFEDASAGANFIFHDSKNYRLTPTPGATSHVIDDYKHILRPFENSLVDVGVLYPSTQTMLDMTDFPNDQLAFCDTGREYFDYDIVDENMIDWGLLSHYKVLLQTNGSVFRTETIAAVDKWLKAGGVLIMDGDLSWTDLPHRSKYPAEWLRDDDPVSAALFEPVGAPDAKAYCVGKGWIYAIGPTGGRDYLGEVVKILTVFAGAQPLGSVLHGFKPQNDGTYITDFPDGRLVYNQATHDTVFVTGPTGILRR